MTCSNSFNFYLRQVEKHYATNSLKPEMHVAKLQLIATSTASNHMKVSWLIWWNSFTPTRAAQKFLDAPFGEDKLSPWLGKAYWYAGVSSISHLWIMVQFSFI
jgi:hypothetical protein